MKVVPIILCGGSGTRLWPLSRQSYPKQLLRLLTEKSLLQETVLRFQDCDYFDVPVIICSEEYRFLVAEQLLEIGVNNAKIILEPVGRNTAPAITVAALYVQQHFPEKIMVIAPSDHSIKDIKSLRNSIHSAALSCTKGCITTFGVIPTRPEVGYGYLEIREKFSQEKIYQVKAFIEKPVLETAKQYVSSGNYLWNSGMFLFHPETFIAEIKKNAPDILESCQLAYAEMTVDFDFLRISKQYFERCPSESIDFAVMEKASHVTTVILNSDWSDIGSWQAVWEKKAADTMSNVVCGDVHLNKVQNSYLHADSRMLAVVGVDNHVIVETADAVLVAHKDYCQDVKEIVNALKSCNRSEVDTHKRVYRAWGYYEVLDAAQGYLVKRLFIKPGAQLSLQMHLHRSEHWIVTQGIATVTKGEQEFQLEANQSNYIPAGVKHRLKNLTSEPLIIIEVQTGQYIGEDDIIRYEDIYGRVLATTG